MGDLGSLGSYIPASQPHDAPMMSSFPLNPCIIYVHPCSSWLEGAFLLYVVV